MALAGRSARRSSPGSRWLVIAVVITLLVLLINASLQSRSQGPGQQLAAGAWIDRILPIITLSNEQGRQIAAIWSDGSQVSGATLSSELTQTAAATASVYQQAVNLRPPVNVAGSSGLLQASLYMRNKAVNLLKTTLQPILTGQISSTSGQTTSASSQASSTTSTPSTTSPLTSVPAGASGTAAGSSGTSGTTGTPVNGASSAVLSALQSVGDDLKIGDLAYQSFLDSLPKLGVTVPPSVWASDLTPYQSGPAQLFLTSLANAQSVAPVHEIKIYSVTTNPPAVSTRGGAQVLPDASSMTVTVVIADVGNQPENNLTVTAAISPSAGGAASARVFENLAPGQSYSVVGMGPLNPPQGVPVTLSVTVTPGSNSPAQPVTQTLVFSMPSQTVTSTTVSGSGASTTPPTT